MIDPNAWAYAIPCEPGEEFDYLVFPTLDDAENELDYRISILEEGQDEPEIIPLYPKEK